MGNCYWTKSRGYGSLSSHIEAATLSPFKINIDRNRSKPLLLFVLHGCEAMIRCWKIEHCMVKTAANTICHQIKRKKSIKILLWTIFYLMWHRFIYFLYFDEKLERSKYPSFFLHYCKWVLAIFRYCTSKIQGSSSQKYWFLNSSVSNLKYERSVDIQPVKNQ